MGSVIKTVQYFNCKTMKLFLSLLSVTLLARLADCKVKSCKMCTSDNGANIPCEESPENQSSGACDPQYGDDYCYVLYTRNFKPTPGEFWNRGCCTPKAGTHNCPTDEGNHEKNEYWEMWRVKCETDDCDIMDPRSYSGGDSNNDGGVVVHGNGAGGLGQLTAFTFITLVSFLLFL